MAGAGVLFEPALHLPDRPETFPAPAAGPALAGHRVWLVPHTHWDREWHLPLDQFRIRLVRTIEWRIRA